MPSGFTTHDIMSWYVVSYQTSYLAQIVDCKCDPMISVFLVSKES
jgi:hypothetical protein